MGRGGGGGGGIRARGWMIRCRTLLVVITDHRRQERTFIMEWTASNEYDIPRVHAVAMPPDV